MNLFKWCRIVSFLICFFLISNSSADLEVELETQEHHSHVQPKSTSSSSFSPSSLHSMFSVSDDETSVSSFIQSDNLSNLSNTSPNPSNQTFHSQLDARGRVNLYWKIHYPEKYLLLEVRAQLHDLLLRPFVAIGFSDYGNWTNADLCVLWLDKRRRMHFQVIFNLTSLIFNSTVFLIN